MLAAPPAVETPHPGPVPRLLVELPSWREGFASNLRDLVSPAQESPLELRSAPAGFWPDVFVKRPLPWEGFVRSGACHLIAFGLLLGLSRFVALQPRVVAQPAFEHSDVIYYQPSEYLPPVDTRRASNAPPQKADPAFSPQPIISVPPKADNHSQTIVTPPKIKLNRDLALPKHSVVGREETADRDLRASAHARGRDFAYRAEDEKFGGNASARCRPTCESPEFAGIADLGGPTAA